MSNWKPTLIAGCILGTIIAVGVAGTATSGHTYHGNDMPSSDEQLKDNAYDNTDSFKHPVLGHVIKHPIYGYKFKHPVYGYTFKHPMYGYKFKHPVHGYIPISKAGNTLHQRSQPATESKIQ